MSEAPPSPPALLPPTADPTQMAIWAGQIRLVIGMLAGAGLLGAGWAAVSAQDITNFLTIALMIASPLAAVVTGLWSKWQKQKAAGAARTTAVASAVASANATQAAGMPVAVTVGAAPPGVPHDVEATHISDAEQAATPLPSPNLLIMPAPPPPVK